MSYLSDVFVLIIILTLSEPVKKFTRPLIQELERDNLEIDTTTGKDSHTAAWVRKIAGGNDKVILARGRTPSIVTLVARYEALKRLSFKLNYVIGTPFLFYLGEGIITYAIHFYQRLELAKRSNFNPFTTTVHFLFYFTTFLVVFISSEICRHMNCFKTWLFDKRHSLNLDVNEFLFLLDSLASKVVSISAYDVVTMSYSMIGTILGLLLTFFIVHKKSKVTNISCGGMDASEVFLYCVKLQGAFAAATFENHVSIFVFFSVLFSLFYKIAFVKAFWVKKKVIHGILNSFNTDPNLNGLSLSCGKSWIESYLFFYFLEPVKKFTRPLLKELERDNLEIDTTDKDSKAVDWARKMAGGNDKMILAGGMTPSIVTLVARYEALNRLSFKLNNVIGSFFLFYLSEGIITYAIHFNGRLEFAKRSNFNPFTTTVHFLFYLTTFLVLFISSEICRQMNFFKSWLFNKRRMLNLDVNEFVFLLDSLTSKDVSISAYDVVTMSYSMLGTVS
ncbi:unnamed protein product [Orchesella dallaii]|uniref:Gustatory receptor n=1 Tax=Orchesella dallaii TaxID=48710 RepID=A0ABP1RSK7_9HEXA